MRPDRLHVAVRPRGVLECLDLALLFCSRRPVGVVLATLVGVAPFVLLNRFLSRDADGLAGPSGLFVVLMEAPWAAVPLTLFLGQAVFAERFSWSLAVRSFLGGLPALLLFQGLLRALCLVIVVLSPVVFVGMFHMNPIILLERPPLSRVWSRRSAMSVRGTGHVIGLVIVESVVLYVGLFAGLFAVLFAWRMLFGALPPGIPDTPRAEVVLPLHTELVMWAVLSFLTVFRFFAYLDTRIRREGWDVELKLRSPATYAGLGGPRARAGAAVLVAVISALGAPATTVSADDRPSAATGERAGAALAGQRFPWYDADRDAFQPQFEARPAGVPERRAEDDADSRRGEPEIGGSSGSAGLGTRVMIGLAVAVIGAAIWLIVRDGLLVLPPVPDAAPPEPAAILDAEQLGALPEPARIPAGELLSRAEALAARGEYGAAMVLLHAWQLVELHRRGAVELSRGKTNGRYAAEVARALPDVAPLFRRSTRLFEDAFFGGLPVSRDDFNAVWDRRGAFAGGGTGERT